jgi:hypothetical protein
MIIFRPAGPASDSHVRQGVEPWGKPIPRSPKVRQGRPLLASHVPVRRTSNLSRAFAHALTDVAIPFRSYGPGAPSRLF